MMFIRSLADFNGTPWAVQVTVGAITVTAQATSSPDRHDTQGSGDFYLAINGDIQLAISGDLQLATNGDFHTATDTRPIHRAGSHRCEQETRRRRGDGHDRSDVARLGGPSRRTPTSPTSPAQVCVSMRRRRATLAARCGRVTWEMVEPKS
jgi:hypothetical protein